MKIVELNLEAMEFRYEKLRVRRLDQEKRLLASLGEGGQQSPIIVVRSSDIGRYVVIDGHKRVRTLRKLKTDTAKSVIWETMPPEALIRAYQIKAGCGFNALEEGLLIEELHRGLGWNLNDVAQAMGKSKSWVSRRLGLVESLPEAVLDGVQKGKIGAYAAVKYLLVLARANIKDCEALAKIIGEHALTSRQVEIIYNHYTQASKAVAQKIMEDPIRFLKAHEQAGKGMQDPALNDAENRALRQMELIGNVALGLTRNLPQVLGYDTGEAARLTLWSAWRKSRKCLALLQETAAALEAVENKHKDKGGKICSVKNYEQPF